MSKIFNVTANCIPDRHYMVDLKERLFEIRRMIDRGDFFTINRARQYGKTTMLFALEAYLRDDYLVIHLDFQDLDESAWGSVADFVSAFADEILTAMELSDGVPEEQIELLRTFADRTAKKMNLKSLFTVIGDCCKNSDQPIVLMIDEVDAASDYDVFLDFLAQLRARYIRRSISPTFQSVILVGVHDIRNLKRKFVAAGEHSTNSPWNVAADFTVDMSFYTEDIAGMLRDYEKDYATGMNVNEIAQEIYNYTSGYPFLVSRICKLLDERIQGTEKFPDRASAWSREGVIEAVGMIVMEKNTLFESLIDKVNRYTDLREIVYDILMKGEEIPFNPLVESISVASMYGFIRDVNSKVAIANRIFETILYNYFLVYKEGDKTEIYRLGAREKIQFIREDGLDMERILERFVVSFNELYGDQPQKFKEDDGRRYFLLYLRPIINGEGNYYIESRTRNMERTDIIIDYKAEQYVIELKLWHGNAYNTRGEEQLLKYMDYYHLDKGYMLSFNFNKKKEIGLKEIQIGGRILIEAVV